MKAWLNSLPASLMKRWLVSLPAWQSDAFEGLTRVSPKDRPLARALKDADERFIARIRDRWDELRVSVIPEIERQITDHATRTRALRQVLRAIRFVRKPHQHKELREARAALKEIREEIAKLATRWCELLERKDELCQLHRLDDDSYDFRDHLARLLRAAQSNRDLSGWAARVETPWTDVIRIDATTSVEGPSMVMVVKEFGRDGPRGRRTSSRKGTYDVDRELRDWLDPAEWLAPTELRALPSFRFSDAAVAAIMTILLNKDVEVSRVRRARQALAQDD